MKTAVVFALIAAVALFAAMNAAQRILGLDDFRLGMDFRYTAGELQERVAGNSSKAHLAVFPVLYPLDLLYLASWGTFLGLCSIVYGTQAGFGTCWPWLVLFPALYVLADFSENLVLAGMLLRHEAITPRAVAVAHWLTGAKWLTVIVAMLQTAGLFGWSFLSRH